MALIINGVRVAGIGSNGKDGVGVIPGGTVGQVLTKKNNIDYDTEWTDLPAVDNTLTISGQIADAKVVGDRFIALDSAYETKGTAALTLSESKLYTDTQIEAVANEHTALEAALSLI